MKNKLIDADSYLKNFCNRFCSVKECTSTQKKSCCIAISLKDEPAVENVTNTNVGSKWIPCSERLPEDRKEKLVYLSSNRMTVAVYNEHRLPHSGESIGWGYRVPDTYIDFEKEEVIAWQPLPSAFVGE